MKAVDLSRAIGCQLIRATGFWEVNMQKKKKEKQARKARSRRGAGGRKWRGESQNSPLPLFD